MGLFKTEEERQAAFLAQQALLAEAEAYRAKVEAVWVTTLPTSPVDDEQVGLVMGSPGNSIDSALYQLRLQAAKCGCSAVIDVKFVVLVDGGQYSTHSQVVGYGTGMRRRPLSD